MRRDGNGRERERFRDAAANGNGGPEARIEDAVMRLARLLGRQIAREKSRVRKPPTTTAPATEAERDSRPETMTLRCAVYARYSSDQQRAASIEDQFRICPASIPGNRAGRRLMAAEGGAEAMKAYVEETNRLNRDRRKSGATDHGACKRVATIEEGGYLRGMSDRLCELEARQDEINERLAAVPVDIPDIRPNIAIA